MSLLPTRLLHFLHFILKFFVLRCMVLKVLKEKQSLTKSYVDTVTPVEEGILFEKLLSFTDHCYMCVSISYYLETGMNFSLL